MDLSDQPLELTFVSHRLDCRGGQERSSYEVLSRLLQKGHKIHLVAFSIENWSLNSSQTSWHRVPGKWIPIQLFKNLWFSVYTLFYLLIKRPKFVITIGVSSWWADLRIVQFVHHRYLKVAMRKEAPLPNERTYFHRLYQLVFAYWTVFIETMLFRRTPHFIAIANQVRAEIEDVLEGQGASRISIIHHCPDCVEDQNTDKDYEGDIKLLFVGALERKGIKKALDILNVVSHRSWTMDVVGDGDVKRWELYAKNLGLDKRVHFWGAKPAIPFFKESHIFLFPSTYEPFGLVVTEAISYGVLPIASRECGSMELWLGRPPWLNLSALDSPALWANALDQVLKDRHLLKNIISDAQAAVLSRSWDHATTEYEVVIRENLKKKEFQDSYGQTL